jgi:hypothetical protein
MGRHLRQHDGNDHRLIRVSWNRRPMQIGFVLVVATDRRIDSKFRKLLPRRGRDCEVIGSAKLRLESWIQNRIQLAPITPNRPM